MGFKAVVSREVGSHIAAAGALKDPTLIYPFEAALRGSDSSHHRLPPGAWLAQLAITGSEFTVTDNGSAVHFRVHYDTVEPPAGLLTLQEGGDGIGQMLVKSVLDDTVEIDLFGEDEVVGPVGRASNENV